MDVVNAFSNPFLTSSSSSGTTTSNLEGRNTLTASQTSSQYANSRKIGHEIGSSYWNADCKDYDVEPPGTAGTLTINSIMDSANTTRISDCNTSLESATSTFPNNETLRLELQLKETQIESLETEIQKLKTAFNQGLMYKQGSFQNERISTEVDQTLEIPASIETVFSKLSSSLQRKTKELDETNARLESIITAVALNPSNTITKFGRYDEEELAHKTITRLEMLTKENREMAKMLGYGRSKEAQIELELLRKENEELKEKIRSFKQQS